KPASNGSVVLVSIGMSNTHLEFSDGATSFISQANADLGKNPKLVVVNGAQGGADAATWADPNNAVWSNLATYLAKAGTKAVQVQVAWLKEAVKDPGTIGPFPTHAVTLQNNLEAIARNLLAKYINLKLVYVSTRSRAYTNDPTTLNPEPFAYETGFGVKWTIQDQIN